MAADSPTPGTDACFWHRKGKDCPSHGPAAPSPVGTTKPPAEAQQADDPSTPAAWRAHAAVLLSPEQVRRRDPVDAVAQHLADAYAAGLAARPSADTETLRRVREAADLLRRDADERSDVIARLAYRDAVNRIRAALDAQ